MPTPMELAGKAIGGEVGETMEKVGSFTNPVRLAQGKGAAQYGTLGKKSPVKKLTKLV